MPISRIKTDGIQDEAVTSAKIGDNIDLDGQFVRVPHGTTAERPGSPAAGYLRFNTTIGTLEQWNTNTNSWVGIDNPPIITSLAYTGSATAADPAGGETITLTGTNFITGANVTVGGTTAPTISVVNSTTITFTTPVKTSGDYDVVVTNANGLAATLTNGISYNGLPAFTTAAGNVGSILEDTAMSTITIVAAEPDGGTLAYSITSGALPTGVSLGSANGQITGTPNTNVTSNTTFNFTVTATDDENQTNSRAFNLIVLRPIYATSIDNSLRFNDDDSSYLSWTPSSAGNRKTWTWSGWLKRGANITANVYNHTLFGNSSGAQGVYLRVNPNAPKIEFACGDGSIVTNALYRDHTAWYHIVAQYDSANSVIKLYVNGEQVTDASITNPTLDNDGLINDGNIHYIGRQGGTSQYLDGYLSDVHFIDGQALTPTSFGEEYYGVWVPKTYSGSYGTNGFKLNFSDSSNLGDDTSGNANDFTASGLASRDSTPDSPTTNFATLNAAATQFGTVSNGNLSWSANVAESSMSTIAMSSGKWYWEWRVTSDNWYFYLVNDSNIRGASSGSSTLFGVSGNGTHAAVNCSTQTDSYSSSTGGDIFSCAYNADIGQAEIYQNNSLVLRFNTFTIDGPFFATFDRTSSSNTGVTHTVNFGQDSTFDGYESVASNADENGIGEFAYPVPSGYLALCAKNLPESTINTTEDDRPEDYFDTVVYNGNGYPTSGTQSISSLTFQPDLVWIKNRDRSSYHHYLVDSVRGATKVLKLPLANVQATEVASVTSLDSNGFTLGNNNEVNYENDSHVAFCWKAGGTPTATNSAGAGNVPTSGSVMIDGVASTSALAGSNPAKKLTVNTKSGFSIVEWTHTSDNPQTIAHGLGVTPAMMIIRSSDAVTQWWTWHKGLSDPAQSFVFVNTNSAVGANTNAWGNTAPTSSVFTLIPYILSSGNTGIAYCFAEVAGFSSFGTFTANQSSDGPYVNTGFKPAFLWIKNIARAQEWVILDNKRDTYNPVGKTLSSDSNGTEGTGNDVDFLSNGFKVKATGGGVNYASGDTMIYTAFAEDPFKYAEAR